VVQLVDRDTDVAFHVVENSSQHSAFQGDLLFHSLIRRHKSKNNKNYR